MLGLKMRGFNFGICLFIILMVWDFISINVRGGINPVKIQRMVKETERNDVILIQESNWTKEAAEGFKRRWDGEVFYNNSDKKGRGVAFLIKRDVCEKVAEIYSDKEGKILTITMEENNEKITVCNIHAPNEDKERVDFFKKLRILIEGWGETIVMGDFNTILERVDIEENMVFKTDRGRKELKDLMEKCEMSDIWRERNKEVRKYSRVQIVKDKIKQSRIDMVLIKKTLSEYVKRVYYKRCGFSDHEYVFLKLDLNKVERGPGIWLLNTEILKDNVYKMEVGEMILSSIKEMGDYGDSLGVWWDNLKYEIKKYSIGFSQKRSKERKMKERGIHKELEDELQKVREGQEDINKIAFLEDELKRIEEQTFKGAMIRSRANYMVEGERCTKFFFNLEKTRQKAEEIKSVKNLEGKRITDKEGILKEVHGFYNNLFTKQGTKEEDRDYLLNNIEEKVSEEDKEMCNKVISQEEIEEALGGMKNGRSPGLDGLGCEFYKVFKNILIPVLNKIFNGIWQGGALSPSMTRGMIKIIYKKKGDKEELQNFRPISLLNCDYKILAKVMANRLKRVLPRIIQTNQAYAVLGRDISDTVNSIRDKIWYIDREGKKGFLINTDLEKAFDRVEHDFLFEVLRKYDFGDKFVQCLRGLYSDAKSCVKCNGFLTDFIYLTRSIRQGCPLSALLYTLVAEPLGLAINADSGIKGIPLDGFKDFSKETKIYQYADDTTLILKDEASIWRAMEVLERYCKGSGARMNRGKTEFLNIGKDNALSRTLPFKEVRENIKILGVRVGMDERQNAKLMWEETIGKTKKRLTFWRRRNLTLKGKILVLNSLFLSKIWYVLGSVSLPLPVLKTFKEMVTAFIWDGKPSKIAYETLIGRVEEGGLGLLDPLLRLKALRIKVVKHFMGEGHKEWKGTFEYFLNKKFEMGSSVLWMKIKENMTVGIPDFYREVLRAWGDFREEIDFKPEGRDEILNQPLFLNPNLNRGNFYVKRWFDAGFRTIRDLFYEIKPGLLPFQAFMDEIERVEGEIDEGTVKKELEKIKQTIPEEWWEKMKGGKGGGEGEGAKVMMKDTGIPFNVCALKQLYNIFRDKAFIKPRANAYWGKMFMNIKEEEIWGNIRSALKCPLLENFDYLLAHNCIFNEMRLFKIGFAADELCKVCKTEKEGLKHMFFKCKELECFTEKLKNILMGFGMDGQYVEEQWEKVFLFGAFKERNKKRNQAANIFLSVARHTVWVRRVVSKQKKHKLDICKLFEQKLQRVIETLYAYFTFKDELETFNQNFVFSNQFVSLTWEGIKLNLPECS